MQLPSVLEDVEVGIKQCEDKLAKLGVSRTSISEQRRYLLNTSTNFSSLVTAAIDGFYTDAFFASTEVPGAYSKRLRAVVQNTLSDFAEQMRNEGHARIILDRSTHPGDNSRCVTRSNYIEEIKVLMKESRGRQLPGTYNPLIVAELFSKQSKPWKGLVYCLSNHVLDCAYTTVTTVLRHTADEETAASLLREVVLGGHGHTGHMYGRGVFTLLRTLHRSFSL
jgi:hypothetical protein